MHGPVKNFGFSKNHVNVLIALSKFVAEIKILNDFYLAGLDSIFCHDWLTPRDAFCHAEYRLLILRRFLFLINMRFWDGLKWNHSINFYPVVIGLDFIMDCFDQWYVFNFFFSFSIKTNICTLLYIGDQKIWWWDRHSSKMDRNRCYQTNVANFLNMTIKKISF